MRVFITRDYPEGKPPTPLQAWAAAGGHELITRSLITFEGVDFRADAAADWWFFYSPRAVAFAADRVPGGVRLGTMGPGTARVLAPRQVDFIGWGSPAEVAEQFAAVAAGQRVFFPRAGRSRRSVERALGDRIEATSAVCYHNHPTPASAPVPADVFVFTSPLNAAAYLDHQPLPGEARVIALGPSTARALVQRGVRGVALERPTEECLVETLQLLSERV